MLGTYCKNFRTIQRLMNWGFRFYQRMFSETIHFGDLAKRAHNFHSNRYFGNPNGENLDLGVGNLQLKFQGDPTVNEAGMRTLPRDVV